MWFYRNVADDVSDNIDRWGCFGVLFLVLIGGGLVFTAIYLMQDYELVWRLVVGGVGAIILLLVGGWRLLTYFPWFW